ncbi:MAG: efflux RND transporter periplasmic adaptor subunit [Alphaproteobacteria bacterium]|nr:efflux RND transporter periplasmic adaptor subunit [Alphaproteobacteria bacterium]
MPDPLKFPQPSSGPAADVHRPELGARRRRPIFIVAVLAVIAGLGLLHVLTAPRGRGGAEAPPPVELGGVQTKTLTVRVHTIGTIVANATVNVTSQVAGQLMRANFTEGQIVRKGSVLFELDRRPFEAALQQARADLARDEAQLIAAKRDETRYASLFAQNAISAQQRDQYTAQAGALAGTVKADEAAVDIARLNLGYASIRSPITGKTGPILIQPGNLVKANDTNPLVVVTQIEPIKVSFFLPQSDLGRIERQMAEHRLVAEVSRHGSKHVKSALVDFVGNQVNNQTGTIELRATFANRDARLVPGELVDVTVALKQLRNATVVPSLAVNIGPSGHYVYVVGAQHFAHKVSVHLRYDNGMLAAVRGHLVPGMKVITVGQLRVIPGHKVEVTARTGAAAPDVASRSSGTLTPGANSNPARQPAP